MEEIILDAKSSGRTPASGLAGLLRPAATSVDEMILVLKNPASGIAGSLRPAAVKKEASEQEATQYVLHEKCEHYHFGNDSEGESTAEQMREETVINRLAAELAKQGKDVAKPKHYRVRTKSKSVRLLTGREK